MAYKGHKNWNHWNVSHWLSSDESLYWLMVFAVDEGPTRDDAAWFILSKVGKETPDGAPYTFTSIRAALVNWDK